MIGQAHLMQDCPRKKFLIVILDIHYACFTVTATILLPGNTFIENDNKSKTKYYMHIKHVLVTLSYNLVKVKKINLVLMVKLKQHCIAEIE